MYNTKTANFNVMESICQIDSILEDSGSTILNSLGANLHNHSRGKKRNTEDDISPECIKETTDLINQLSDYLHVTPLQAALFCAFLSTNLSCRGTDIDDIKRYFDISGLNILCFEQDVATLVEKNIIDREYGKRGQNYLVNSEIREAIIQNKNISKSRIIQEISRYEFVDYISDMISDTSITSSSSKLFYRVQDYEKKYNHLTFIKEVKTVIHNVEDRTLFYKICADFFIERSRRSDVMDTLKEIYPFANTCMRIMNELCAENHLLQNLGLIQLLPNTMISDSEMELSEKGRKLFLEKDFELFTPKMKNNSLIYPNDIKVKSLFFEETLQNQISTLEKNLQNEQFVKLQNRLSEQSLPQGIAAIFYGAPGTGKTETVMQLAKATGRSIMQIDISATKSCWYGESQKIIKKLFSSYKDLCKTEDLKPILLFNEADAVFTTRQNAGFSNVSQTENAIQNIILEEMENLEGILIATTNLVDNLDSAFERRFLFKVCFTTPTEEAKTEIWKSKLPWLAEEDAKYLAATYNFSGGEIDNIVRKILMEELFTDNHPSLSFIADLCRNEKIRNNQQTKIGFQVN